MKLAFATALAVSVLVFARFSSEYIIIPVVSDVRIVTRSVEDNTIMTDPHKLQLAPTLPYG